MLIKYRALLSVLVIPFIAASAMAQRGEVTITLNESFFDALLEAVYRNFDPPEFSIADAAPAAPEGGQAVAPPSVGSSFAVRSSRECSQSVKLLREMRGTRTAVRFREGRILAPIAFSGTYAAPLLGCIDYAGWAETNVVLEFDESTQRIVGRVRVNRVNLNGTGGIGGAVVARLLQGTIDRRLNPIEVIGIDHLSFAVPVQRSGRLKMRAVRVHPEVSGAALHLRIEYEFSKG